MSEDTPPENLRKFLESDDPALVRMGISMAKGSGVKVTVEDIQNILIGDYANLSLGLEFAKEVGIEDEAIEVIIGNFTSSYYDDSSLMDGIIASNNGKAIDALIDYGSYDYEERCSVIQFFSENGVSQLNKDQKQGLKTLAECHIDGCECLDLDDAYEAKYALEILKSIGDIDSLSYFNDAIDGACFNTDRKECDAVGMNFMLQEELSQVIAKILSEEKDKIKIRSYLSSYLEDDLDTLVDPYQYYDNHLKFRSNILGGLDTKDNEVNSIIQKISKRIKDSREKHPPPEDFGY